MISWIALSVYFPLLTSLPAQAVVPSTSGAPESDDTYSLAYRFDG